MREGEPVEWISVEEAAEIIGVSRATAYRSVQDPERRARQWGEEGQGWRERPLGGWKRSYQVNRKRAEELAPKS